MALITEVEAVARAQRMVSLRKSTASQILAETASADQSFDVFLSHSSNEPENILLGIKGFLEDAGMTVYVDRYTDSYLVPEMVTRETADTLRSRLRHSRSLLYVHSEHSKLSRWMPWELGFMDGATRRVGIAPVASGSEETFAGEQYLGLYPYIDRAPLDNKLRLWINRNAVEYADLKGWVDGSDTIRKRS